LTNSQQFPLNKIICGECVETLKTFPAECVDLTVTSPPYDEMTDDLKLIPGGLREYDGYELDFGALARELYRVTKSGGVAVWVVGDMTVNGSETLTSFRQALYFRELGFNVETMIYQVKGTGAKGSNRLYWQAFEYMFVLSKGRMKTVNLIKDVKNVKAGSFSSVGDKQRNTGTRLINGKVKIKEYGIRTNVWGIHSGNNGDDQTDHSAPFPEALARDHIISWSNPGDVVLDPLCGSGTTLKMAHLLERNYIGIEVSKRYCKIAKRRVANAVMPIMEALKKKPEQGRLF
jgi:DNA modification methylase